MKLNPTKLLLLGICLAIIACKPQEMTVETYPNGNPKKAEYRDSEGKLVAVQLYSINNIRKEKFAVQNGLAHGEYTSWNLTGGLLETGQMANGERTGEWTIWYDSKTPHLKGAYQEGKKHGEWQELWYEGELRKKLSFNHGDTTGLEEHYSRSGQVLFQSTCHDSGQRGVKKYYSLKGTEIKRAECLGELLEGEYKEWDEEGDLMVSGHYHRGVKDKEWIYYRKITKGQTQLSRLENWNQGRRVGKQLALSSDRDTLMFVDLAGGNGVLKYRCAEMVFCPETTYVEGQIEGKVTSRAKDRYRVDFFKNNELKQAKWYEIKDQGELELSAEGFYEQGKKDSIWKSYYPSGKIHTLQTYKSGELMGLEQNFDSLGNLSIKKIHQGKNMPLVVNFK